MHAQLESAHSKYGSCPRLIPQIRGHFRAAIVDSTQLFAYTRIDFMDIRSLLALVLLIGFSLSVQNRSEPDFAVSHSSLAFHTIDLAHEHEDPSRLPSAPRGAHKDQHGCYHSHAPFLSVTTVFVCESAWTKIATPGFEKLPSHSLPGILRPPRA